jgi:hypothetical protein
VSAVGIIILLFLIQTVLYFFSLFYNKTSQNTPTRDDQTKWKMPISFIGGLLGLFLAVIGLIINYTIEAKAEDAFWASAGLFFTIPVFMFIGWVIDKAKNYNKTTEDVSVVFTIQNVFLCSCDDRLLLGVMGNYLDFHLW